MTVKELFAQVEHERVTDAFTLLDYTYSEENFENTFFEKYDSIPRLRKMIAKNIQLFAECTPNDDAKLYTIFIAYNRSDDDFENQCKMKFSSFAICDEEVIPVLDKNFHVFDEEGEVTLSHYDFDDAPMQDMANYTIAESSIEKFGKEICAAKILSELFFWGVLPDQREKAVKDLYEHLSKPIDKNDLVDGKIFEEMMRKYDDELMSDMTDDERIYHDAKKRFEEETEGVVRRHWQKVKEEVHMQYIKAIKEEYRRRKEIRK